MRSHPFDRLAAPRLLFSRPTTLRTGSRRLRRTSTARRMAERPRHSRRARRHSRQAHRRFTTGEGYLTKHSRERSAPVDECTPPRSARKSSSRSVRSRNATVSRTFKSSKHRRATLGSRPDIDGVVILDCPSRAHDYKSVLAAINGLCTGRAAGARRQRGDERLVYRAKRSGESSCARPEIRRRRVEGGWFRDC